MRLAARVASFVSTPTHQVSLRTQATEGQSIAPVLEVRALSPAKLLRWLPTMQARSTRGQRELYCMQINRLLNQLNQSALGFGSLVLQEGPCRGWSLVDLKRTQKAQGSGLIWCASNFPHEWPHRETTRLTKPLGTPGRLLAEGLIVRI